MKNARLLLLALPVAGLLGACRTETTRPQPEATEARKAAQAAQQAPPSAVRLPAGGAPRFETGSGSTPGGKPGPGQGAQGNHQPHYLPPSEQGAFVEMSETPAGSEATAAREVAAASSGAQGDHDQGGTGGNVPHALAAEARQGVGGGLPPQGNSGRQAAATALPRQAGVTLAPGAAVAPAQAAAELDQNLAEFRRLMERAQAAAAADRATSPEGERGHQGGRLTPAEGGYGAGGAAGKATGLGASPDLMGETSGAPRAGGPSAVQVAPTADETIVARQLREAAEREPDPVLREKLWVEYRNYTRP